MRVLFVLLTAVAILGAANLALSSPITGARSISKERVEKLSEHMIVERFRGGERACVIVRGDHDPVVDIELHVLDEKGQTVAKDIGGGDLVAVVWYPPRDANYRIRIVNHGQVENYLYVTLK